MENNAKGPKLGLPNYFRPLKCEKMGKVQNNQNWAFMIISDHFKPLCWEKNEEKNGKIKIGHSQSFCTTLVGKDWKSAEQAKLSVLNDLISLW